MISLRNNTFLVQINSFDREPVFEKKFLDLEESVRSKKQKKQKKKGIKTDAKILKSIVLGMRARIPRFPICFLQSKVKLLP